MTGTDASAAAASAYGRVRELWQTHPLTDPAQPPPLASRFTVANLFAPLGMVADPWQEQLLESEHRQARPLASPSMAGLINCIGVSRVKQAFRFR